MANNRVQKKGTNRSPEGLAMYPYLTQKYNTYYFRQSVPAELRSIVGKREIKKSLGTDYAKAVRECKRFAVEADNLLAEARAKFDSIPIDAFSPEGIRRTKHVTIKEVTPNLEKLLANLTKSALLETDQQKRIDGMSSQEFEAYSKEIELGVEALRRQLSTGNVAPMIPSAQLFLIGRGYAPELQEADYRRLAYVMTEATLEAYEAMALRQTGHVVKQPTDEVFPSQFELQNQAMSVSSTRSLLTWQQLYDVWVLECARRENTKASYLAAMKLFMGFCKSPPHEVTREDALAYRDYLLQVEGLATGTVSNKIGFVGTLINSGRNSSKYAKLLPHNPFADIKIKQSKRGKADGRRLPFSDNELKKIFGSSIYTEGHRPKGGGGEACVWIPAIGYLTGMRLEEIALLHRRQFNVDAKGNHYIHTEDGKNDNSTDRDIPIHPMLIEVGLLDYVANCSGRLFPKVKSTDEIQSKAFSKWYGRFLTSLGITANSKVFHSFRHLFKDLCRNAGLDDSAIDQICGHEPGTVGGRYGSGRRIDVLADLIRKIEPPVGLLPILKKS